jgi:FAD synthetase
VTLEELATKYIRKTERAFEELKLAQGAMCPDESRIIEVVAEAKRYLEDAKYYLERNRFETSLTSIAYCEGLLDALRMLGYVEFSW